jgi:hypothetical protein
VLHKADAGWKIAVLIIHDPDEVARNEKKGLARKKDLVPGHETVLWKGSDLPFDTQVQRAYRQIIVNRRTGKVPGLGTHGTFR